jgi:hypothetical protein
MTIEFDETVREEVREIIHTDEKLIEFELCARLGIPSVAAVAHELDQRFPTFRKNNEFKQWVGSEVARVMRPKYEVTNPRKRCPWANYFTYGAVWGKVGAL